MAGGRGDSPGGTSGIKLLSAIPGRERWQVKAIGRRPNLAQALEKGLMEYPGVYDAHANPVSGRVLVLYEPGTVGLHVESIILNCLGDISSHASTLNGNSNTNASPASTLTRVVKLSLPERKELVGPVWLSMIGHTVSAILGLSFIGIFNTAQGKGPGFLRAFGLVGKGSRILFMTGLTLLLVGAEFLTRNRRKKAWRKLAQDTQHNLRAELISRIEMQDMAFFDQYGTGHLISLVTEDTARIRDFVERAGDESVELGMVIVVYGTLIALASPGLAILSLLSLPFVMLASRIYGGRARERYASAGEARGNFTQMLENNLTGIADVKSFTAEHREALRLSAADERLSEAAIAAVSVSAIQAQLNYAFFNTAFFLTAGYGGYLAATGKVTKEKYVLSAFLFPQLLSALRDVEQITGLYHGAANSAEKLAEVLDSTPSIRSGPARLPVGSVRGEVAFENVSFGYDPSVKVLDNVSFKLGAGETLAIVGPTGSGKSTLLNLLLRFYDVDSGQITLDGTDIRESNLHDLRSSVSLVSQDVHLFQGTVLENVLYGQERASREQVIEALRDAEALNLLESLPGGLEAQVGERGQRLSGGERQRVAIARALLKLFSGASILALDEATSQLDNETEAAIKRSLRKAASGKSVVIIAHRLSTIRSADRIVVLERGKIIEEGTHKKLLARKGLYASLWRLQNEDPLSAELEVRIR